MHEMQTVVRLETHVGDEQIGGMGEQLRVRALEGLADANGRDRLQCSFDIVEHASIRLDEEDVLSRRRHRRRPLRHPAPRCSTKRQLTVQTGSSHSYAWNAHNIQYFGRDERGFIATGWPVRTADCGDAAHPMDDWRFLLSSRANVLLEGPDRAIDRAVIGPVAASQIPDPGRAPTGRPRTVAREGTLILRDLETLSAQEQQNLLFWLDDAG